MLKNLMAKTQFFYYDVDIKPQENQDFDILSKFKDIKEEKEVNKPFYVNIDDYRVCVITNSIIEDSNEAFILGKFIASEDTGSYREEKKGEFYEIELSEEDAQLCNIERGALFFVFYIDKKTSKNILMFEAVNFSIGIGGFRTYFNERYKELDNFITKQKLGRDLKPTLQNVIHSGLKIAKIRVNRDITKEQIEKLGVIEKAGALLIEEDIDCELVFRFRKNKKTFKQFLTDIFNKEDVTDLLNTEFGDFFRKFHFTLDNTANKTFNFFDRIFKFELPLEKIEHLGKEEDIFKVLLDHFKTNKEEIISQE